MLGESALMACQATRGDGTGIKPGQRWRKANSARLEGGTVVCERNRARPGTNPCDRTRFQNPFQSYSVVQRVHFNLRLSTIQFITFRPMDEWEFLSDSQFKNILSGHNFKRESVKYSHTHTHERKCKHTETHTHKGKQVQLQFINKMSDKQDTNQDSRSLSENSESHQVKEPPNT